MHASASAAKPSLLVFADDWGRHPSSCQHLVRHLQAEFQVVWANTIGTRRLRLDAFTLRRALEKATNWTKGTQSPGPSLSVVDVPMMPGVGAGLAKVINPYLVSTRLSRVLRRQASDEPIILTTLPYVGQLTARLPHKALVYYCTDDYSFWPGADRSALQSAEAELCRQADLVIAASRALSDRLSAYQPCRYLPHGVDYTHFASTQTTSTPPPALTDIPGPRIGFFGLIYEKLDFELLSSIARQFADANLVMIGPVDYCPEAFRALPNVHFLGKQPYSELPNWLAGLDVLLMPYVDDEMIRQSNPLKLRECLATGKPTVCVDVPEARLLEPHVRVAADRDQFLAHIREALAAGVNRAQIASQQRVVAQDDWSKRADMLSAMLKGLSDAAVNGNS